MATELRSDLRSGRGVISYRFVGTVTKRRNFTIKIGNYVWSNCTTSRYKDFWDFCIRCFL